MKTKRQFLIFFIILAILILVLHVNIKSIGQSSNVIYKTFKVPDWSSIPIVLANEVKGGIHQVADINDLVDIPVERLSKGYLSNVLDADGNNTYKTYQYVGDCTTNVFPDDWNEVMLINKWMANMYYQKGRLVLYNDQYWLCNTDHLSNPVFDAVEESFFNNISMKVWGAETAILGYESIDLLYLSDGVSSRPDSTVFVIQDDGKVGVGVENPLKKLHIDAGNDSLIFENISGTGNLLGIDMNGNVFKVYGDADEDWLVETDTLYSAFDSTIVVKNGRVGIGTINPGAKLEVAGPIWQTFTGNSVFIGEGAGENDNLQDNGNAFVGYGAGNGNTIGNQNSAFGFNSLFINSEGVKNTGVGYGALRNSTGDGNSAMGFRALHKNTTGSNNTAQGYLAGSQTAIGTDNLVSNNSVYIGYNTRASATGNSNEIIIGSETIGNGSNTVTIGNDLITSTVLSGKVGVGTKTPGAQLEVNGHIWQTGTGNSIFLGDSSGFYDNLVDNRNIFIGRKAGFNNVTGVGNIAIGDQAQNDNINSSNNLAIGLYSLLGNLSGSANVALGNATLRFSESGNSNTAIGYKSMHYNESGSRNIAVGDSSLINNTVGGNNIAVGSKALFLNTTGDKNIAVGVMALNKNLVGNNCAVGYQAMFNNIDGSNNTAISIHALFSNVDGNTNVAVGAYSMKNNTSGYHNSAIGVETLYENTIGYQNVAHGVNALHNNTDGYSNTAIGNSALYNIISGYRNTAIGISAGRYISSGLDNQHAIESVFVGYESRPLASGNTNEIVIGSRAIGEGSNTIRLGNTSITQIHGQVPYTFGSDKRLKTNVISLGLGLDFISKLKPVSYRRINNDKNIEFGFLAQEIKQTLAEHGYENSGMVSGVETDSTYLGLRYSDIIAPLVKSVQELSDRIIVLEKEIHELKKNKGYDD